MNLKTLVGCLILAISVSGCEAEPTSQKLEAEVKASEPLTEETAETSFSILSDTEIGNTKRSVDVRLADKVSEAELREYALTIKNSSINTYANTFITYYLPDTEVGSGAWASTHFNPDLDVRILGLSLEDAEKLSLQPIDETRELIGTWFDERPYVGARISIFNKHSKIHVETIYKDGSGTAEEVRQIEIGDGVRLEKLEESSFGEYWILSADGELAIYDNDGLILKYRSSLQ